VRKTASASAWAYAGPPSQTLLCSSLETAHGGPKETLSVVRVSSGAEGLAVCRRTCLVRRESTQPGLSRDGKGAVFSTQTVRTPKYEILEGKIEHRADDTQRRSLWPLSSSTE
jgi:hypothetical protein